MESSSQQRKLNAPLILDSCVWVEYFKSENKLLKEIVQSTLDGNTTIVMTETIIQEVCWKLKYTPEIVEEFLRLVIGTETQGANPNFPLIGGQIKSENYYQIIREAFSLFKKLSGSKLKEFIGDIETIKSTEKYALSTGTKARQWRAVKVSDKSKRKSPVAADLHDIFISLMAKPYTAHIVTQDKFFALLLSKNKIPIETTDRFYFYNKNKMYEYIFQKQDFEEIYF